MLLVQEASGFPSKLERDVATGLRYIVIEQVIANYAWDVPRVPDSQDDWNGTKLTTDVQGTVN